jgi:Fe-S cluster assembly scaffold protein SufB
MATKETLQNRINTLEDLTAKKNEQIWALEAEVKALKLTLESSLPELEKVPEGAYWAQECNIYSRNQKPREAANKQFNNLKEWAGRNLGYGDTEEEKQATGLGGLVYLRNCEVSFALRFAAEVCEQHNWHQEAAKLMYMYDREITPHELRQPVEKQTVSWWAE